MIITKKRIINLRTSLVGIEDGARIFIGLTNINRFPEQLRKIGFSENLNDGDTVLPASVFGNVSLYNAEGKDIVHRDQPKERAYRQVEWSWNQWRGRYNKIRRTKIVDVPYERYPRTFAPPPSVEMTIMSTQNGQRVLVTAETVFVAENYENILHIINLFLEIFGECNVMNENLELFHLPAIRRLNWKVLPQGRMPWAQLKTQLDDVIQKESDGKQPLIKHRFRTVSSLNPDFFAIGQGGFDGYVVFGFSERNLFVLESRHFGNATYVLGDNWETISQKTKAEILDENLARARLIHRENWEERLREQIL